MITAVLCFLVTFASASQLTLGAWFWYTEYSPASWNKIMGMQFGGFQAELHIPANVSGNTIVSLDLEPGYELSYMGNVTAWDDGTNADAFITVYANEALSNGTAGLDLVSDEALIVLAKRLNLYSQTGRRVFLRWCPEMNGSWMYYGPPTSPDYYVSVWKRMFTIVREYAPDVLTVWSPNFDLKPNQTDYWPGSDYVDYVGTSVYFKGNGYNSEIPSTYVIDSIATIYTDYAQKYNKRFYISEASGGWEVGQPSAVTQLQFQQEFWSQILSAPFVQAYPLLEGVYIFDFLKKEEYLRDFRVSFDPAIRAMFQGLMANFSSTGLLAMPGTAPTTTTTTAYLTTTSVIVNTTKTSQGFVLFPQNFFTVLALLAYFI